MGIYDRDYYRNSPRGRFGEFIPWSVTSSLIAINIAVFFLDRLLGGRRNLPLETLGYFSLTTAVFHLQVWRFITCQFLHVGLAHLFGNMLGLYFFGPIAEAHLGPRRYLAFYLLSGMAGAVFYILMWCCGMLIDNPQTPLIGASGAIFGVLIATAMIAPGISIQLWFPPIPLTVRTLALIYLGFAVYQLLTQGAGGQAAHLGGAIMGFLLIKNQHWLNPFAPARMGRPGPRRKRVAFRDWTKDPDH